MSAMAMLCYMFDFVLDIIVGQDLSLGDRMLTYCLLIKEHCINISNTWVPLNEAVTFQCELCLLSYTGGTARGDCRLGFPVSQLQTEGGPSRKFDCVSCWSFYIISWSH